MHTHTRTHTRGYICPAAVQLVSLDPSNKAAAASAAKIRPIVEERREKLKEEMMGASTVAVQSWDVP